MRWAPYILAALGIALAFALPGCSAPPHARESFLSVDDRPMLETPQQVQEARLTGRCAVRFGDELCIIENLPAEYVEWSSWRVRMP